MNPRAALRILLVAALAAAMHATSAAAAQTVTLRYGPVSIAGYETKRTTDAVRAPGLDGYLTAMHARVVDSAGNEVPKTRVMLHHVLFVNRGYPGAYRHTRACGPRLGEPFYGTGEENQALALPEGYGYPLRARDGWRMGWMLMNHGAGAEQVYIEYSATISTQPEHAVKPYWSSAVCNRDRI